MPLLNPDGYEYSRTHQRLWRKNRRRPTSDNQCFGVDLNRNFDVIGFGVGASNQSCSDSYSGPFAASEPEVKAAAGVVATHSEVAVGAGEESRKVGRSGEVGGGGSEVV